MGWGTGSEVAERVWNLAEAFVPKAKRAELACELVALFRYFDCDTMGECDFVEEYLEYDDLGGEYKIKGKKGGK